MKVGDVVRWTLPDFLSAGYYLRQENQQLGIIVKMNIGNGADVAWFGDNARTTWTPLAELEVISES